MGKIQAPPHKHVNKPHGLTSWHIDLVEYLDRAMILAQMMVIDPESRDPVELVQNLLEGLERLKGQVFDGSLTPPDGKLSLGLARFVSDWVHDLHGPLHRAVSDIEQHYLLGAKPVNVTEP